MGLHVFAQGGVGALQGIGQVVGDALQRRVLGGGGDSYLRVPKATGVRIGASNCMTPFDRFGAMIRRWSGTLSQQPSIA